jgi:hypothetical protein
MLDKIVVNSPPRPITNPDTKLEETQKETKSLSTNQKVIIGATAAVGLTAATIGGILYSKGKTLSKEIDNLAKNIKNKYEGLYQDEKLAELFDIEKVTQHINDALKLPKKKERLAKLQEIQKINDRGLAIKLEQGADIEKLPQNIQEAIANKDQITASKLYIEYCDSLFTKSKTAGATIEESVENVFGKGSIVTPHTYTDDVELVVMSNNTSGAGFHINVVDKENTIADKLNWKASKGLSSGCCAPGYTQSLENEVPKIISGNHEGRTFVTISYGKSHNGPAFGLTLFGKKGSTEFTKAQKDLMELDVTNLTKEQIDMLSQLPRDGQNANYDAVLSLLQTLVEKAKCVF